MTSEVMKKSLETKIYIHKIVKRFYIKSLTCFSTFRVLKGAQILPESQFTREKSQVVVIGFLKHALSEKQTNQFFGIREKSFLYVLKLYNYNILFSFKILFYIENFSEFYKKAL